MPDIAMCSGFACWQRDQCYRHRAIPNGDWQTWAVFPVPSPGRECGHFLPIYPGNTRLRPVENEKQKEEPKP